MRVEIPFSAGTHEQIPNVQNELMITWSLKNIPNTILKYNLNNKILPSNFRIIIRTPSISNLLWCVKTLKNL